MNPCSQFLRLLLVAAMVVPSAWAAAPESSEPLTPTAAALQKGIRRAGDNRGLPYLILDKQQARIWIFDATHHLVESAPVLVGSAVGDHSVPGIGTRPLAQIRPEERTTPAGRFLLEAGLNLTGEDIFWIDYDAAVSLHRVRPGRPTDQRLHRLATATPSDNRISYGCVNVPTTVYNRSVHPQFSGRGGYAYVLPERQTLVQVFPFLQPVTRGAADPASPTSR